MVLLNYDNSCATSSLLHRSPFPPDCLSKSCFTSIRWPLNTLRVQKIVSYITFCHDKKGTGQVFPLYRECTERFRNGSFRFRL